ncbi:MAG: HNH endonuclease [Chitinophagaceae bacterium]
MNKVCIWCKEKEPKVSFTRIAHIFPKSLGGQRTCENVCDYCNLYFGSKQPNLPSVELALKEPLNISRMFLLSQINKARKFPRFKSEYFDYDLIKQSIKPKYKYRLLSDFQYLFTKQFKRGVYKVFLEERSQSVGDALNSQFDFIREFARYGIGDYPVFYCRPKVTAIFMSEEDTKNPVIRFTEHSERIMQQYGFYSYFFITHILAFPVIRNYEITIENYINFLLKEEKSVFNKLVALKYITDLDFTFSFALKDESINAIL